MRRFIICFALWAGCFMFFSYKMGFSIIDSLNCVIGIAVITIVILIPFIKFKEKETEEDRVHENSRTKY